jgi:NAD(P)-dependent dehydrogenase (short-subunit alcohol dehydrogenase family)
MSYTSVHHTKTYPSLSSSLQPYGTVLITGGGTGIGAATAHSFARSGTKHIILLGRRPDPLASTAESIRSVYPETKVTVRAVDVLSAQALTKAFEDAGRVDVVIHAASVTPTMSTLAAPDLDMDAWWTGFEINVRGAMNVARALIQSVREGEEKAVFVNLNTAGTLMPPLPGMGGYIISKSALLKMMDYFAAENGDKVRLVSVHPGLIRTEMALQLEEKGLVFPYEDSKLAILCIRLTVVRTSLICEWYSFTPG